MPGFRQGKVPNRVVKSRVDAGYARGEAIQVAVPRAYDEAIQRARGRCDRSSARRIPSWTRAPKGPVVFTAIVEVRPELTIEGYGNSRVSIVNPHAGDDEVADQIDKLRTQFGELVDAERPVEDDDYVTLNLVGSRDGEEIAGLDRRELPVPGGFRAGYGPKLDTNLIGLENGETTTFGRLIRPHRWSDDDADSDEPDAAEPPTITFEVEVLGVQERQLPDLTDEWVADATEFETVAELRDDFVEKLSAQQRERAQNEVRNELATALVDLVTEDVPEALVQVRLTRSSWNRWPAPCPSRASSSAEQDDRAGARCRRAPAHPGGRATGEGRSCFACGAVDQGLKPTDDELDEELAHLAFHAEVDIEVARTNLASNGQMLAAPCGPGQAQGDGLVDRHRRSPIHPARRSIPELLKLDPHDHGDDHDVRG